MSQQSRQQGEISTDQLTMALQAADALPRDRRVALLTGEEMSGGFLSRTIRLRVAYDEPAPLSPTSLVGKFPADDDQVRAVAGFMGMYSREVSFYRQLAGNARIALPQCFVAEVNNEDNSFQLVLEDIPGAVVHNQDVGCDRDDARLALIQVARLHAAYWGAAELAEIGWLNRLDLVRARQWQEMFGFAWGSFIDLDGVDLRPDQIAVGDRLAAADMAQLVGHHESPLTAVHNDFHLGNLLYVGSGAHRRVVTVDWQMVSHAPALVDVAFFLGRMPTERRRAMQTDLVRDYHTALLAGGVTDYSWDQCWLDYQRSTWFGVLSAVMALAVNPLTPEHLTRHARKIGRFIDQVVDHDALRFLSQE